jgi:hypothetical protein
MVRLGMIRLLFVKHSRISQRPLHHNMSCAALRAIPYLERHGVETASRGMLNVARSKQRDEQEAADPVKSGRHYFRRVDPLSDELRDCVDCDAVALAQLVDAM